MTLALRLAEKGRGTASPNPMVGALVVKGGRIVGQAYHHRAGRPHAEVLAIRQAGIRARGATLYVTLEPCCHTQKRTPPCVPDIIRAGIRRVVIAMTDPNPMVKGRGTAAIRRAKLAITTGVGRAQAEALNRTYRHWMMTKRPHVTLKAGMTLDGQIATSTGESRWITGRQSRREVHRLRSQVDAVLVGAGTVIADNPSLTARMGRGFMRLNRRQPLRVVVDGRGRIPLSAKILSDQWCARTLVAVTASVPAARLSALRNKKVETIVIPAAGGRVLLPKLLAELGRRGVTSLLIEGGSELNAAMLRAKLVDHVMMYVAPALLGGDDARGVIGGKAPVRLIDAIRLRRFRCRAVGADILIEGDL